MQRRRRLCVPSLWSLITRLSLTGRVVAVVDRSAAAECKWSHKVSTHSNSWNLLHMQGVPEVYDMQISFNSNTQPPSTFWTPCKQKSRWSVGWNQCVLYVCRVARSTMHKCIYILCRLVHCRTHLPNRLRWIYLLYTTLLVTGNV